MSTPNQAEITFPSDGRITLTISLYRGTYEVKETLKAQGYKFDGYDKCWRREVLIAVREEYAACTEQQQVIDLIKSARPQIDQAIADCPLSIEMYGMRYQKIFA